MSNHNLNNMKKFRTIELWKIAAKRRGFEIFHIINPVSRPCYSHFQAKDKDGKIVGKWKDSYSPRQGWIDTSSDSSNIKRIQK